MSENFRLPLPQPPTPGQSELDLPVDESLVAFARRVASGEVRPFGPAALDWLLQPESLLRRVGRRTGDRHFGQVQGEGR